MNYINDIFFDTGEFSLEFKIQILKRAHELSYHWWSDVLRSYQREKIEDADFDESIKSLNEDSHFVIIHRRGYVEWNTEESWNKWKGEIAFRTLYSKDIFVFLYLTEENLYKLLEEFKITKTL
jgi:hypothetical protein